MGTEQLETQASSPLPRGRTKGGRVLVQWIGGDLHAVPSVLPGPCHGTGVGSSRRLLRGLLAGLLRPRGAGLGGRARLHLMPAVAVRLEHPLQGVQSVEHHGELREVLARIEHGRLPAVLVAAHEHVLGTDGQGDDAVGGVQVPEVGRVGAVPVVVHALQQRDQRGPALRPATLATIGRRATERPRVAKLVSA